MGEPVTKERLKNYLSLQIEYYNNEDRLARLKNDTEMPALQAGDGSQRSLLKSSQMEKAFVRKMDQEKKIKGCQHIIDAELNAIEDAVDSLPDPLQREVLRLRYMDSYTCRHMKWGDVAKRIYEDSEDEEAAIMRVWRIHGNALQELKKLGGQK